MMFYTILHVMALLLAVLSGGCEAAGWRRARRAARRHPAGADWTCIDLPSPDAAAATYVREPAPARPLASAASLACAAAVAGVSLWMLLTGPCVG